MDWLAKEKSMSGINTALKDADASANEIIRGLSGVNTDDPNASDPAPAQQADDNRATEIPEGAEQAPTASEQDTPDPHEDEEASYKTRYDILRGKYQAEVPRMAEEIRQLKDKVASSAGGPSPEMANLQNQVAELTRKLSEKDAAETPAPTPSSQGLDELRDEYGANLVDGLVQLIGQQVDTRVNPLRDTVANVEERANKTRGDSFMGSLKAVLDESSISMDDYNNDPLFIDWLKEPAHELDSTPRQELLNKAVSSGDVVRSAHFFKQYVSGLGASRENSQQQLKDHVQIPERGVIPAGDADAIVWSTERIKQLYDDKLHKKITDDEFARLERDLYASLNQ